MLRYNGMLVVLVVALAMTFGGVSSGFADTASGETMTPELEVAAQDTTNGDGEKDKPGKKDGPSKLDRDYSKKLQSKVQKPGAPAKKPKYKPWNKVITKEHQKHDGLIPIYTKQEEVYFELSKSHLDAPMLGILTLSQGIGARFVYGGLPIDEVMFDFHRNEDHIQVRRLSTLFRAPDDKNLQETLKLTFSESILEVLPIVTEQGDKLIVDASKLLLSDISGMSSWLGGALQQPVRLSRESNYFESIKNYPENTEIDTRLTYSPGRPEGLFLPSVPDSRFIQIGVHFSIRQLPAEPMIPRIADDRVGYFPTTHKDFTREKDESFFVHYANRWRLEKKDSSAAVSEPKEPIVFYLDHTIPEEYVNAMKEGVEWWQRAFEEAGFKNAIIAKRAPTAEEDPEYDPADARYNTIRWNTSDQASYGAIGPSRVDPRTGEILDADILFEHNMVASFGKSYRRLSAPRAFLMELDPNLKEFWMTEEERAAEVTMEDIPQLRDRAHRFCAVTDAMMMGGHFLGIHQMVNGFIDPNGEMSEEYVQKALAWVASHEVGHTLGLRHNFKSSGAVPYSKLNDKKAIDEIGMTGSVMDYPTPNIARNKADQGYFYSPTVGTYDRWAIRWGYSEVAGDDAWEQAKNLTSIASQSVAKANYYGTDEDTYPLAAMDPRANTSDLSDDPMAWAKERIAICDDLMKDSALLERVVKEDDNYVALRSAVQTVFGQRYVASLIAVKNLGGNYTARAHRGSGELPYDPVPAATQQQALDFIIQNGVLTKNYAVDPALLTRLSDDKFWSWENQLFSPDRRFDFPLTEWVSGVQSALLMNMLMPVRQARIVEQSYISDKPFKLSQVYAGLTTAIWTENPAPRGRMAAMDRNLQRNYTDLLTWLVTMPVQRMPDEAVSLARLNLRRIRQTATDSLQRQGLDDETNAHLMETIARIDRALDAQRFSMF